MSSNLIQEGTRLLSSMGRNAQLIMQAYVSGTVDESGYSAQTLEQLVQYGILWRPEEPGGLRLKATVRNLIESSLQDDHSRNLNTNISASLASLKALAQHYLEALEYGRYSESNAFLNDITHEVYQLIETLSNSVRLLFSRINDEFGYVSSLDAKIRENELAQSQVSDLRAQLEHFKFDELSQLSGNNRELRQLLVVSLQQRFSQAAQELSVVQGRLIDLLGRFREFRGRTRLLKGFLRFNELTSEFVAPNYALLSNVPHLFNQAKGLLNNASVDVSNTEHESQLLALADVLTVQKTPNPYKPSNSQNKKIELKKQGQITLSIDPLQAALEQYFAEVLETGQPVSALSYHKYKELDFDHEIWIYRVIGGYQALPEEDKNYLALDTNGRINGVFSGNFFIHDVTVGLR